MITFCSTCKNRTAHLRQTLPVNLAQNPQARFVVLDYNSQDDLLEFLRSFEGEIKEGRLTVYSYEGWPKFRMAHAKNLAHRLGIIQGGDVLLNLDADNFAGENFDSLAAARFAERDRIFMWSRMIKGETDRGISGRIAVTAKAFQKLGGYDEKYAEWSPDDKDFNVRLRASAYEAVEIEQEYLKAVRHSDVTRFKEWPHLCKYPGAHHEFDLQEQSVHKPVANDGRIGCGAVYRNFERDDVVEVKPLATRIFGIGYPKTGTCSLHQAFQALGYDSWHWSSAHTAKAIWQEMHYLDRSPTVERYDALCDLPIPILYRELDVAYPGSKFVLTVRNERKWLDSIRRHFRSDSNIWRHQWDMDPFSHRVHSLTYGRSDFDASTFLERYRRHNAEVQEYFRFRPNDLLTLNLDKGEGWGKLAQFLGQKAPLSQFPHENRGTVA